MKTFLALALIFTAAAANAQQPIDVAVKQVNDRRTSGFFAQLAISLELPKFKASEVAATRVLVATAVDDSGRDLVDHESQEPQLEPSGRGSMGADAPPMPAMVSVTLKNPERKAKTVKQVRGEIELYMPGKDPNSVAEIAKFVSQSGKPLTHKALKANGVEITFLTPAQVDSEKKRRADAKKKEYADTGMDADSIADMLKSFLESLLQVQESEMLVRVKDPNKRIQQIVYVDAAGEVKNVSMRDEEGLTLLSTWAGKPEPDWKMRVSMKTAKNVARYVFALNDVPLP